MNAEGMKAGDSVEFMSDRQTEKGPSGGSVRISRGNDVLIRHSDCEEEFNAADLHVHKKTTHHRGGTLWQLI